MSNSKRFSWMIRPKGFINLLGGEYELMKKAGSKVITRFYISSFVILLIAFLTAFSIKYAVELLFHMLYVEILMSAFISLLFVIIYIFLINTFTKTNAQQGLLSFSNITRVGFVLFIGFVISKPVEVFLFKNKLAENVRTYKQDLVNKHASKINLLYAKDEQTIQSQIERKQDLNINNANSTELAALRSRLSAIDQQKKDLITKSEAKILNSDFLVYQVKIVSSKYPLSWIVTIIIIALFLLPGYLIYSTSGDDEYFKLKTGVERRMIDNAYNAFCEKYSLIFKEKYGLNVEFYSKYQDPPYNTKPKKLGSFYSSDDFHKKYSGN